MNDHAAPDREALKQKVDRHVHGIGNLLVDGFHYLALFAIGAATVWSGFFAFVGMVQQGRAGVADILLLAIAALVLRFGSHRFPAHDPQRRAPPDGDG